MMVDIRHQICLFSFDFVSETRELQDFENTLVLIKKLNTKLRRFVFFYRKIAKPQNRKTAKPQNRKTAIPQKRQNGKTSI